MRKLVILRYVLILFALSVPFVAGFSTNVSAASVPDFYRETIKRGARDTGTSAEQMSHVRELQYRLKWAGYFHQSPTGYFGEITQTAVRDFQKNNGLTVSGVATQATWKKLIIKTIRKKDTIPSRCKTAGYHICYDRSLHRVVLYKNGVMVNEWLVRGGSIAADRQTRLGDFKVLRLTKFGVSSKYGTEMHYSQTFNGGQALHASPDMMDSFVGHSHGCINMYYEDAKHLWALTFQSRLYVHVYGAWS